VSSIYRNLLYSTHVMVLSCSPGDGYLIGGTVQEWILFPDRVCW